MADESTGKKKGSMSVSEAGRKGGQSVRDKYGHSFYEEIGRKGGETVKAEGRRAAKSSRNQRRSECGKGTLDDQDPQQRKRRHDGLRSRPQGRRTRSRRAGRRVLPGDRPQGW